MTFASFVRWPVSAATAVALCMIAAVQAVAADAAAGRALAEQSCSACHALDSRNSGGDAAPSFARLATINRESPGWVRAWLSDPHPPMTGINLSRAQIDDIVAYLQSLPPMR
jgi:mono/diheme cytochrome c family protein